MFENFDLRLPEIGKIKIGQKGEKTVSRYGKEFQKPEKLDYFKVVKTTRGDDGNYITDQKAVEKYGDKPTELNIRFISPRLEDSIQYGYALYDAKGNKLCFGDGKTGWRLKDPNTGEVEECSCGCEYFANNQCKKWVKLACIVEGVGGIGGVHTLTLKGRYTVPAFCGSILLIKNFCDQNNGLINEQRIKLKLSEFSSKFGKVYSPFCELAPEDFIASRKEIGNSTANFKLLADAEDTPEETEIEEEKAEAAQPHTETKAIEAPKPAETKQVDAPKKEEPKKGWYWCENKLCKDPVFEMEISDENKFCSCCDNKFKIHLASDGKRKTAADERLRFLQSKKTSSKTAENVSKPVENVSKATENASKTVENVAKPAENVGETSKSVNRQPDNVSKTNGNASEKSITVEKPEPKTEPKDTGSASQVATEEARPSEQPNLVWHWCECKECMAKAIVFDTEKVINTATCPSCHKTTLHVAKINSETSALEERKAFLKRKEDLLRLNNVLKEKLALNNADAVKEKISFVLERKIKSSAEIKPIELENLMMEVVDPLEDPDGDYGTAKMSVEERMEFLNGARQNIRLRREWDPDDPEWK